MPRKRTTFFSLRYEKNYQYQILNAVHDMMQIGSCNLHRAICIILLFSFSTQPNKTRERTASQWVGKYKWLDVFFTNKKIFSALLPLFIVLLSQFTYDMSSIFNQAMKVVLACLAISCMGYIVTHITWNKRIDDVVQCFGRESLSIYVTHNGPFAFMLFLKDVLPLSDANNLYSIFLFLLISLFISWIAVGIKKVLSLSSVLSFLLYGKKLYLKENKK